MSSVPAAGFLPLVDLAGSLQHQMLQRSLDTVLVGGYIGFEGKGTLPPAQDSVNRFVAPDIGRRGVDRGPLIEENAPGTRSFCPSGSAAEYRIDRNLVDCLPNPLSKPAALY